MRLRFMEPPLFFLSIFVVNEAEKVSRRVLLQYFGLQRVVYVVINHIDFGRKCMQSLSKMYAIFGEN